MSYHGMVLLARRFVAQPFAKQVAISDSGSGFRVQDLKFRAVAISFPCVIKVQGTSKDFGSQIPNAYA